MDQCMFTPRFKSAAARAGWDEETLLIATLVVDDTPERESKQKRRLDPNFRTPPSTNSRRKRRGPRRSPIALPVVQLNLDDEKNTKEESGKKKKEDKPAVTVERKVEDKGSVTVERKTGKDESTSVNSNSSSAEKSCPKAKSSLPCMDKLREELSCAICLEICFEPSTTPCGHSFCKKCLKSAADRCGKKCPKCRQLISNGRSCTVNTVLWNTIQLLFPQEIEARKVLATPINSKQATSKISAPLSRDNVRNRFISNRDSVPRRRPSQDEDAALALRLERENLARLVRRGEEQHFVQQPGRDFSGPRRSSRVVGSSSLDGDAALALRLQREEFRDGSRDEERLQSRHSLSSARANLRAMASRAVNSTRGRYS
ncbi:hypothetical protein ACFE04_010662 [Oxalis oulophora]